MAYCLWPYLHCLFTASRRQGQNVASRCMEGTQWKQEFLQSASRKQLDGSGVRFERLQRWGHAPNSQVVKWVAAGSFPSLHWRRLSKTLAATAMEGGEPCLREPDAALAVRNDTNIPSRVGTSRVGP